MTTLETIANVVSMIGTSCGLFSRVPQVYRTYTTQSAGDLSNQTMMINIFANSCFLFLRVRIDDLGMELLAFHWGCEGARPPAVLQLICVASLWNVCAAIDD